MTLYALRKKIFDRMANFKGPVPELIVYRNTLDWVNAEIAEQESRLSELKKSSIEYGKAEEIRKQNRIEDRIDELERMLGEKEAMNFNSTKQIGEWPNQEEGLYFKGEKK